MDDTREEMRRLIDVIEKGAKSTSVEQAVDDIKLFAKTASFLANPLDTRLKSKDAKPKKKSKPTKTVENRLLERVSFKPFANSPMAMVVLPLQSPGTKPQNTTISTSLESP